MPASKLYAFDTADWDYEYSSMVRGEQPGETYASPCPCYLVDHPEGTVLVDTGVDPAMVADPEHYGNYGAPQAADHTADIETNAGRRASALLTDVGYSPEDVDVVVLTHLHLDHAGDVKSFADAEIVVQQAELEYAWWPADPFQRDLYLEGDFGVLRSPEFDVTPVEGRYDVFGDGAIECVPTPGHTAGHQSVKVDLENEGTVVLGGDVAFLETAYEADRQPSFAWDTETAIATARRLRNDAQRWDADVYLAHDRDHLDALPEPPAHLD
ncbi:N-acyl homoserine lactonase family protein [Halobacterium noricense]|uniref:N-acyl homoserine lactonase family protein n=1 Tax=Halobacterium noricense TaxID=223182 RepID=UPI001E60874E|nr:N-acyl homoserine lactonase family protein [Halobacterium noricense]UHH26162.1 N-acyl homoserine lactonase family protein [Halobacterium noricense]